MEMKMNALKHADGIWLNSLGTLLNTKLIFSPNVSTALTTALRHVNHKKSKLITAFEVMPLDLTDTNTNTHHNLNTKN